MVQTFESDVHEKEASGFGRVSVFIITSCLIPVLKIIMAVALGQIASFGLVPVRLGSCPIILQDGILSMNYLSCKQLQRRRTSEQEKSASDGWITSRSHAAVVGT